MAIVQILQQNSLLAIIGLSAALALFSTLVQKYATDQALLKAIREEIKKLQDEIKQNKDNPQKVAELQNKIMPLNTKMMSQTMKPMLITIVPFIVIFAILASIFGAGCAGFFVDNTSLTCAKDGKSLSCTTEKNMELSCNLTKDKDLNLQCVNANGTIISGVAKSCIPLPVPFWKGHLGWIGTYLIFSIIFTTAFRKALKVV